MNEIEATILGQFEDKLYRLRHKYQEAVEQNKKFREALQEQKNMLQDLSQRYSALEQKYNNLKFSHREIFRTSYLFLLTPQTPSIMRCFRQRSR